MLHELIEQTNLNVFGKDKKSRYTFCNDKFAEAAGVDSPSNIVG